MHIQSVPVLKQELNHKSMQRLHAQEMLNNSEVWDEGVIRKISLRAGVGKLEKQARY